MFDLEQSIAGWRRQMLAAGLQSPTPLDELENHLREDMEQQIKAGVTAQAAFAAAVQRIGPAPALESEFQKTCATGSAAFKRIGLIGLAGTVVLNLLGLFVFHRGSSIAFSPAWWSAWFPEYLAWTTFTIIGLAGHRPKPPLNGKKSL